MEIHYNSLPKPIAQALLREIAPGGILESIRPIGGDHSNAGFYLDAHAAGGEPLRLVVKLYQGERNYCIHRARTEYQTLQWLHLHNRPTSEPLFLDESGSLLGGPGLVTRFLPGKVVESPPYPADWGRQMALTLAGIHAYPCDPLEQSFLLDANHEALWFRKNGSIPAWLEADPDGNRIWNAIEALVPRMEETAPKLIHLDYWGGNLLCHNGEITAVVDWEEASFGDPGVDVGYCLMDLALCGLEKDAAEFLSAYEAKTGESVANLTLWKLAAAARPIYRSAEYFNHPFVIERFRRFVQEAARGE